MKARVESVRSIDREGMAMLYARLALGAAFLSAVASRFGLYGKASSGFKSFVEYTGQVNSFMPAATIPYLAWGATVAETVLGVALIAGVWLRWTATGAAVLLAIFGTAMAISFGIKSPMDYSVFSASAAAALLAVCASRRDAK
jgi:uncharacterized membrane protein YphA (DoxX/SURF4 family)